MLVWIHGGGLTQDGGRNYNPTTLAADGVVVVTINYRLGALGFLAHPALAARPGGPAGNYGLMDQQAALRWVQANIRRFGGNPHNVTIAGESAGGLSVLAQMVSPAPAAYSRRRSSKAARSRSTSNPWPPPRPLARPSRPGRMPGPDRGVPAQAASRGPRQLPLRRDPRRRRRPGPHRADRDSAGRRAVRPRAGPRRDQP